MTGTASAIRYCAFLVLGALLSIAGLSAALAQNAPQIPRPDANLIADQVIVPNFWDPKSRIDRPESGSVKGIRFLTTADFPPFQFRDRRGVLIGFNVDLATAICKVMKVECALQIRPFDTLQQALTEDGGDAIIAGLSEPRARAAGLSFTRPYFKIPARFAIRRETVFDIESPGAGFVGTVCNSAHQAYLAAFFPDFTIACYPDALVMLEQLRAGSIDLIFADALTTAFWLHDPASLDCCRFASGPFVDERYFGPGMSIAVRTDDRMLKQTLDYALRELHRTGVYEELYLRYFPVSLF
jgi:polar amino acid transport system substrate-binding protein